MFFVTLDGVHKATEDRLELLRSLLQNSELFKNNVK